MSDIVATKSSIEKNAACIGHIRVTVGAGSTLSPDTRIPSSRSISGDLVRP